MTEDRLLCIAALKSLSKGLPNANANTNGEKRIVDKLLKRLDDDESNYEKVLLTIPWYEGMVLEEALMQWKDVHSADWSEKQNKLLNEVQKIVDWREECFDDFWRG